MLNPSELASIAAQKGLNSEVAHRALEQTYARAQYCLNAHERIQTKAGGLMRLFLSAAIGLLSVGFAVEKLSPNDGLTAIMFASGTLPLIVAIGFLIAAQRDRKHGTLGTSADWWLREGVIDGSDQQEVFLAACTAWSYQKGIDASMSSNARAVRSMRRSIVAACATPLVFLGLALFAYF